MQMSINMDLRVYGAFYIACLKFDSLPASMSIMCDINCAASMNWSFSIIISSPHILRLNLCMFSISHSRFARRPPRDAWFATLLAIHPCLSAILRQKPQKKLRGAHISFQPIYHFNNHKHQP